MRVVIQENVHLCESNQQIATIQVNLLILVSSTVSGVVFTRHQELFTVFTVSGNIHPSSCQLVSWMSFSSPAGSYLGEYYEIL
jgi:hypothetical protein